jgi:hypothetical protein
MTTSEMPGSLGKAAGHGHFIPCAAEILRRTRPEALKRQIGRRAAPMRLERWIAAWRAGPRVAAGRAGRKQGFN